MIYNGLVMNNMRTTFNDSGVGRDGTHQAIIRVDTKPTSETFRRRRRAVAGSLLSVVLLAVGAIDRATSTDTQPCVDISGNDVTSLRVAQMALQNQGAVRLTMDDISKQLPAPSNGDEVGSILDTTVCLEVRGGFTGAVIDQFVGQDILTK